MGKNAQRRRRQASNRVRVVRPTPPEVRPERPAVQVSDLARKRERARELAQAAASTGAEPSEVRWFDVEIMATEPDPTDPDDDAPGWIGECGLRGNSTGYGLEWSEDLAKVVASAVEEAEQWAEGREVRIAWEFLDRDGTPELFLPDAALGLALPERLPAR